MSINYTTPQDPDSELSYLLRDGDNSLSLDHRHKYYTQCQVQTGVTGLKNVYILFGHLMDTLQKRYTLMYNYERTLLTCLHYFIKSTT